MSADWKTPGLNTIPLFSTPIKVYFLQIPALQFLFKKFNSPSKGILPEKRGMKFKCHSSDERDPPNVSFAAQMDRNTSSREPRKTEWYSSGGKCILVVKSQGIAQITVSLAVCIPALGKGFPNVIALLQQERVSPTTLLQSLQRVGCSRVQQLCY